MNTVSVLVPEEVRRARARPVAEDCVGLAACTVVGSASVTSEASVVAADVHASFAIVIEGESRVAKTECSVKLSVRFACSTTR